MASGPITSWQIDGETMETVSDFILGGSKITADGDCSHEIKRRLGPWKKSYDQPRQHIKKQRHCFTEKGPSSQSYGFSSSHGWMWELEYKESWAPKNWCFWTVMLKKTLESPLDCKEIQPVHPKGNQSWIFTGRTDAEAETPILWSDVKNWLIGKDPAWCWERLKAGEQDEREWDDWMASPTWWTWVWASSRSWWWKGKPGALQSMGSQRVVHDWVTELNWIDSRWRYNSVSLKCHFWVKPVRGSAGGRAAQSSRERCTQGSQTPHRPCQGRRCALMLSSLTVDQTLVASAHRATCSTLDRSKQPRSSRYLLQCLVGAG